MPTRNLILSMTNSSTGNALVAIDAETGAIASNTPTGGNGGVSGNAGAVQAYGNFLVAALNFGSNSLSIFFRFFSGFRLVKTIATVYPPVSVTFGLSHMYVATTKDIRSFGIYALLYSRSPSPDGIVVEALGDGSIAQVIYVDNGLKSYVLYSEKHNNGFVSKVDLSASGALTGSSIPVALSKVR